MIVLSLLTSLVALVAIASVQTGVASWPEAISFATGAICVWLVVRESVWNFPFGIVSVAIYGFIFFQTQLYADAGLQVVYFLLGILGMIMWIRGGKGDQEGDRRSLVAFPISRIGPQELIVVSSITLLSTLLLWLTLHRIGGSASFWDALTTSVSLASQWMLNRKQIENWLGWIFVDIIYVPLYLYKELYLTSFLYAVFLCMAILGWIEWRRKWHIIQSLQPSDPVGDIVA